MGTINVTYKPEFDAVYHTGLYGDRAEAFFKWFRYQLLDQYYSSDAEVCIERCSYFPKKINPSHLAKIGMLMKIEHAPDNEIILGFYRYVRCQDLSSFYNTSLTLITNQISYNTTASLPSTFPIKNTAKLKRWIAVYAMKFAKENIIERHVSDMRRLRNKYSDNFDKMPKCWPSAFGLADTDLDRNSNLIRSSITYQTALEADFASRDKEFIIRRVGRDDDESNFNVETTTIALTDAEICYMVDFLLGRGVNKEYGGLDKSQFHGTPANPIIAECEAERRRLLETASADYDKDTEDARVKAADLYRALMDKFRAEAEKQKDELYAKLCGEATAKYDKQFAKAQELAETVNRLSETASKTSDVASLAAMF